MVALPVALSSSSVRWAQTPIFNSRAEATPLGEKCRMKQEVQTGKGACKALWGGGERSWPMAELTS